MLISWDQREFSLFGLKVKKKKKYPRVLSTNTTQIYKNNTKERFTVENQIEMITHLFTYYNLYIVTRIYGIYRDRRISILYPGFVYFKYINTGSNLGPEKISLISGFLSYPGYTVS